MNVWSPAQQRFWTEQALRADKKRYERARPRADKPWTVAEDNRLLKAVDRADIQSLPHMQRGDAWQKLSVKFKRSPEALKTRAYGLRAGLRLCRKKRR
ncbi:MAG: hypothetical protein ACREJC_21065 [Tepidisphaeraceae bacterium]